jgi:hypothetical protein
MTTTTAEAGGTVNFDLGFTVGLDMRFEKAIKWAASERFDLVELYSGVRNVHQQLANSSSLRYYRR